MLFILSTCTLALSCQLFYAVLIKISFPKFAFVSADKQRANRRDNTAVPQRAESHQAGRFMAPPVQLSKTWAREARWVGFPFTCWQRAGRFSSPSPQALRKPWQQGKPAKPPPSRPVLASREVKLTIGDSFIAALRPGWQSRSSSPADEDESSGSSWAGSTALLPAPNQGSFLSNTAQTL